MTLKVNRRVKDIVGSTTLAITARAKELKTQGHDVVNFAGGEPDFDTPESIKAAGIKAIQSGFTKYTPSVGTIELRKAIAKKFKEDNHLSYEPSQIVVSCGAKHCLYDAIQVLADDGDEVIIPTPYWVSYPEMVKLSGAVPKFIPTSAKTQFKITPQQLRDSITTKTRMLIMNSPSNPTGMVYHKRELEAIAEICVKHHIFVLSDEIYEKLIYEDEPYVSMASLGKDIFDLTITVNGVSKTYAMTGWRIGYCAGDQEIMDYIQKFQDHTTSNPTSISQVAALAALQASPDSIMKMREEFKKRRDLMMSLLDKVPEISYIKPNGAFYLFCDFSQFGNSEAVAKQILDEMKVAVIPGDGFGAPSFLRLSFSTSMEQIEEGIKRIASWIKNYKRK